MTWLETPCMSIDRGDRHKNLARSAGLRATTKHEKSKLHKAAVQGERDRTNKPATATPGAQKNLTHAYLRSVELSAAMRARIQTTLMLLREGMPARKFPAQMELLRKLKVFDAVHGTEDGQLDSKRANYNSVDTAYELQHALAHVSRSRVHAQLQGAGLVSMITDETQDISGHSQLVSLSSAGPPLRWVTPMDHGAAVAFTQFHLN